MSERYLVTVEVEFAAEPGVPSSSSDDAILWMTALLELNKMKFTGRAHVVSARPKHAVSSLERDKKPRPR